MSLAACKILVTMKSCRTPGTVYADAFSRDQEAWALASSDKPPVGQFSAGFLSDQYGGFVGPQRAGVPRAQPRRAPALSDPDPDGLYLHLGLPFFYQAVRGRWSESLADLSAWLLALYPESVLVGASQMREPFLLGFSMLAFWAVFASRDNRRQAGLVFVAAMPGDAGFLLAGGGGDRSAPCW